MTKQASTHPLVSHSPWTDAQHNDALAAAKTHAEACNRKHRRTSDIGFFATATLSGFMLLGRDSIPQSVIIALACAAALALTIALRSGTSIRSIGCLMEEWMAEVGTHPLVEPEILLLRSHARTHPAAQAALDRWSATGLQLRQRDFDALVDSLHATGIDVPHRSRVLDDARWAAAL